VTLGDGDRGSAEQGSSGNGGEGAPGAALLGHSPSSGHTGSLVFAQPGVLPV
jgi:hypothetical protein